MEERSWIMAVDDDRTCLKMIEEIVCLQNENGRLTRQLHMLQERLKENGRDEEKADALLSRLTLSEQKVARLILLGYNNQDIATQLCYSQGYVKNLTTRIYDKLCIHNRCELWKLLRNPSH